MKMIRFWSVEEYFRITKLLEWLHFSVEENIKGKPYEHFWYSDGSASWCYKGKTGKWEITKHMNRVTFYLNNEYDLLFMLKFE